jgi:hypothetical protein
LKDKQFRYALVEELYHPKVNVEESR